MSLVIPDHARNQAPGKRAARAARRALIEARQREEKEAGATLREQRTVAVLEEIRTSYQERLLRLGDPIVAKSGLYLFLQSAKERLLCEEHRATIDEAWHRFNQCWEEDLQTKEEVRAEHTA
jgi:hypothetical protein